MYTSLFSAGARLRFSTYQVHKHVKQKGKALAMAADTLTQVKNSSNQRTCHSECLSMRMDAIVICAEKTLCIGGGTKQKKNRQRQQT